MGRFGMSTPRRRNQRTTESPAQTWFGSSREITQENWSGRRGLEPGNQNLKGLLAAFSSTRREAGHSPSRGRSSQSLRRTHRTCVRSVDSWAATFRQLFPIGGKEDMLSVGARVAGFIGFSSCRPPSGLENLASVSSPFGVRVPASQPTRRSALRPRPAPLAHRRSARPKGLDRSPGPVRSAPLPRRAPPPLGYFAETPRAAPRAGFFGETSEDATKLDLAVHRNVREPPAFRSFTWYTTSQLMIGWSGRLNLTAEDLEMSRCADDERGLWGSDSRA